MSLASSMAHEANGGGPDTPFLVFLIDEIRYALRLAAVERVVRIVEIIPLPKAPSIIRGLINVQGRVLAVADSRVRFGLPRREIALTDQLIIARTAHRPVALLVDRAGEIFHVAGTEITDPAEILPRLDFIAGVVKRDDGTILIHDLDHFLSLEEEEALGAALASGPESADGS